MVVMRTHRLLQGQSAKGIHFVFLVCVSCRSLHREGERSIFQRELIAWIENIKHGSRFPGLLYNVCFIHAQIKVSLAIIGVDELFVEVEWLAAVLTRLVDNVVVSVVVHKAEPLQERVQNQV